MGKSESKKPQSKARTTSVTPSSLADTLTAFSPSSSSSHTASSHTLYAHLHRAPDAHTLRIYETATGKCISRWATAIGSEEEQKVASIAWCYVPAPVVAEVAVGEAAEDVTGKRGSKKRRKSDSAMEVGGNEENNKTAALTTPKLVLALGLENGSILLWSPKGNSATTLAHPTSDTSVESLSSPASDSPLPTGHLWSAHADGTVRVWDLATSSLTGFTSGLGATKWSDLAVRYLSVSEEGSKKQSVQLLLSHLSLHVYTLSLGSAKKDKIRELKTVEVGRCTGHIQASFVQWTTSPSATPLDTMEDSSSDSEEVDSTTLTFLSYSPSDRFVQLWSLPLTSTRTDGALIARLALDTAVQSISIGTSPVDHTEERVLAAIDVSGKISLARLPNTFPSAKGKNGKSGVIALEIESEITGRNGEGASVAKVDFVEAEVGKLVICRGGVKPVFDVLSFCDSNGAWISKVELEKTSIGLLNGNGEELAGGSAPTRYSEDPSSTVRSGDAIPDANSDDEIEATNSGELDVDMAEPTLADRLKAMNVSRSSKAVRNEQNGSDGEDEEEEEEDQEEEAGPIIPATTLTTTLIQALHSSDAPLLESCLVHTSPSLIRSTVKRLPSGSLVLGLLEVLVERLGKGKKGKQGSASVKRARGLIEWVRQVLIVHVGFLVTIPSLVTRLATLHSSLTSRLALQPTLLALNGRLELVMSQIDLRQQRAAERASIAAPRNLKGSKYVEGESDEEEGMGEDDDESDEGSVEDVVLGSDNESGEDDDDEDEDDMGFDSEDDVDEDDDDEDEEFEGIKPQRKSNGKGPKMSDLLDLEASEDDDSEDGDDDSEDDGEGSESEDED